MVLYRSARRSAGRRSPSCTRSSIAATTTSSQEIRDYPNRAAATAAFEAMLVIRLGRISYVNMAPVFYRVDAEVEEVQGVPTELNRMLVAGELDTAPISSIEYARNADSLRLLPRLCVASEGAVDSIQLVSRVPLEQVRDRRGDAGVRDVRRADEGAAAGGRAGAARGVRQRRGGGEAPDRRRRAALGVRGSDAAPRPRQALARADRAADGVRGLGVPGAARRRARGARGRARLVGAARARRAGAARARGVASATAIRPASSRATSRSSATASVRASAPASTRSSSSRATPGLLETVPELRFVQTTGAAVA